LDGEKLARERNWFFSPRGGTRREIGGEIAIEKTKKRRRRKEGKNSDLPLVKK